MWITIQRSGIEKEEVGTILLSKRRPLQDFSPIPHPQKSIQNPPHLGSPLIESALSLPTHSAPLQLNLYSKTPHQNMPQHSPYQPSLSPDPQSQPLTKEGFEKVHSKALKKRESKIPSGR